MPPKLDLVQAWLTSAERDLVIARRALEGDPLVPEAACFHCQQAVEKGLKAILVLRETEPPRTHVLGLLLKRCAPLHERLAEMKDDLEWLTAFAVDARYPDVEPAPTVEQAARALAIAEQAFQVIQGAMPPEVCC